MSAFLVSVSACGDGVEPVPPGGTLHVAMRTVGNSLDADGYAYQVGSTSIPLAVQDTVDVPNLPAGTIPLALSGLADNCRAFSPGPGSISVGSGAVDTVSLVVSCDSALRGVVLFVRLPEPTHPEVWMMRPDGSGVQRVLTDGLLPVATPNGTQIIFQDWTTLTLSIIRADGTKRRPFVPTLSGGTTDPDVSPDGRYVVFTRSTQVGWDVYRSDLNGGDIRQLTQGAFDTQPRWSPDGQLVVFTRWGGNGQLLRVPAEGGDAVPIAATDGFCCARWSPDGTRLLFWDIVTPRWLTMAPDGTDIQTVDALPESTTGAVWSPDGLQLMTVRSDGQLWRVPLDGRDAVPTTAGSDVGRWLP